MVYSNVDYQTKIENNEIDKDAKVNEYKIRLKNELW